MTPQPLTQHELADMMATLGRRLYDQHPHDVLTLAGFLATQRAPLLVTRGPHPARRRVDRPRPRHRPRKPRLMPNNTADKTHRRPGVRISQRASMPPVSIISPHWASSASSSASISAACQPPPVTTNSATGPEVYLHRPCPFGGNISGQHDDAA